MTTRTRICKYYLCSIFDDQMFHLLGRFWIVSKSKHYSVEHCVKNIPKHMRLRRWCMRFFSCPEERLIRRLHVASLLKTALAMSMIHHRLNPDKRFDVCIQSVRHQLESRGTEEFDGLVWTDSRGVTYVFCRYDYQLKSIGKPEFDAIARSQSRGVTCASGRHDISSKRTEKIGTCGKEKDG